MLTPAPPTPLFLCNSSSPPLLFYHSFSLSPPSPTVALPQIDTSYTNEKSPRITREVRGNFDMIVDHL